jgi:hypothetical protein
MVADGVNAIYSYMYGVFYHLRVLLLPDVL